MEVILEAHLNSKEPELWYLLNSISTNTIQITGKYDVSYNQEEAEPILHDGLILCFVKLLDIILRQL